MLFVLTRRWWLVLLKGIAALFFGLLVFSWTRISPATLASAFGVYCLADGLTSLSLARSTQRRRNPLRRQISMAGVFSLLAATVALLWTDITIEMLAIVAAVWAIARGVCEIGLAIELRKIVYQERLFLTLGYSSLLFGAVLALWRFAVDPYTAIWTVGIFAAVRGGLLVAMALELRGYRNLFRSHGRLRPFFT